MRKASRKKQKEHKFSASPKNYLTSQVTSKSGFLQKPTVHMLLIVLLGVLAYSNTFYASFNFDDFFIFNRYPAVRDLNLFIRSLGSLWKSKTIGFLTYALNYKLHGLNVAGYHIFNIATHIINSILVYWLVTLTYKTPYFVKTAQNSQDVSFIALFSSLLFVSHPLQTQSVTYIFQRFTSLCTMFYLLSLVSYIKSRLSTKHFLRYILYAFSIISAILAMKTKELALTLPVVICLFEFMFFEGTFKKRLLYLTPILLTLLIIPLSLIGMKNIGEIIGDVPETQTTVSRDMQKPVEEIIGVVSETTRIQTTLSRPDYLFTQFRVIVTYIRLLFLPVNQNLDYDYPVYHSFANPNVFISFLFLLSIFIMAVYLLYRSKHKDTSPSYRLISFGIFWFFITLSVTSSIIPIVDIIFEHRVYLPSAGIFIAATTFICFVINNLKNRWPFINKAAIPAFALIIIILSGTTYARNTVWKDEITLWEDVVKKSPKKARGYNNLGVAYKNSGLIDKAIENYQTAVKLNPYFADPYSNLGVAYNSKGLTDKALEYSQAALKLSPNNAEAHINLGVAYGKKGLIGKAITNFRIAIKLNPYYAEAHYNLGVVYNSKGLLDKAIENYQTAIRLKPDFAEAYNNMGIAYISKSMTDKAIECFKIALKIKPDYSEAYNNLNIISSKMGYVTK